MARAGGGCRARHANGHVESRRRERTPSPSGIPARGERSRARCHLPGGGDQRPRCRRARRRRCRAPALANRVRREVAGGALGAAGDVGLAVTAIPFDPGDGDGAARSVQGRRADVLLVAGGFDDELAIAARLLRRRWRAVAFVAAGVDEVLAPVADRLTGVYGPCQWLPDAAPQPEDGPDSRWFTTAYLQAAGSPPPTRRQPPSPPGCSGSAAHGTRGTPRPRPCKPLPSA